MERNDISISAEIGTTGDREITAGRAVAYGSVDADGSYYLRHAPTQRDYDLIASMLDSMTPAQIARAQAGAL